MSDNCDLQRVCMGMKNKEMNVYRAQSENIGERTKLRANPAEREWPHQHLGAHSAVSIKEYFTTN